MLWKYMSSLYINGESIQENSLRFGIDCQYNNRINYSLDERNKADCQDDGIK